MLTYLIDDDPISLYLAEQVLLDEGLNTEIQLFGAAEEALHFLLSRLATALPQVILLDLNMPLMDGWQFLDALAPYAAALRRGGCHLYILTSSLAVADVAKVKQYDLVTAIIHKPIGAAEVLAIKERLGAAVPEPGSPAVRPK
jgi:CheY-like chemotaxis protein